MVSEVEIMEGMEKRCTGHCCAAFIFPLSPEELESVVESYKNSENNQSLKYTNLLGIETGHNFPREEVEYLHDMLIYKELTAVNPATGKQVHETGMVNNPENYEFTLENQQKHLKEKGVLKEDGKVYRHTYTCKHFDGKNCTAYESRPNMCRAYPGYGSNYVCEYKDCTASCSSKNVKKVEESNISIKQIEGAKQALNPENNKQAK